MTKVLISGAGSGLGRALAERYAKDGAEVCVSDVNAEAAQTVAQEITADGGQAFAMACDITKQWDVEKLSLQLAEKWGELDILINNAGVATAGTLEYESMEQWEWVFNINVLGHIRMSKAFVPFIKKSTNKGRAVINVASQAGITSAPGMGSYCASKAAIVSFSETLYLELAPNDIHVSVVCPAFFDTNLNASLRSDQPGMSDMVDNMIKKSGISAASIAEIVFNSVNDKRFMLVTHKSGRNAHRLKRYLPIDRYLKMVQKRLNKFGTSDKTKT